MEKYYKFEVNSIGKCTSVEKKTSGMTTAEIRKHVEELVKNEDIIVGEKTTGSVDFIADDMLNVKFVVVEVDGSWDEFEFDVKNPF